jgi:uncharacterized protein (DUF433 family)
MSTRQPERQWVYLAPNPKSAYKQLFIKGTRIRAEALYAWTVDGIDQSERMTPEEVAADYGLPLEAVREAIEYCQSNPEAIAEDHRREEARMAATGMDDPNYKGRPRRLTPQEIADLEK